MKRVLVLLRRDGGYDRNVMRGAIEMARLQPGWQLRVTDASANVLGQLGDWRPDAVIGRLVGPDILAAIARWTVPAVTVSNGRADFLGPRAGIDDPAVGELAAAELIGRGFRDLGYVPLDGMRFSDERQAGFGRAIARLGARLSVGPAVGFNALVDPRSDYRDHLVWLAALPKPSAILAANDVAAAKVLDLCGQAGIDVPEQVAVLGVDDDELVCDLAAPALSSIAVPARRIGEEAVGMLAATMAGELPRTFAPGEAPVRLFAPTGVVHRRSTDILATDRPELRQALRFIRDHRHEPITVTDVLEHVPVSRRWLEQAFRRTFGHTPLQEIHRAHVDLARDLLVGTNLTLPQIAQACGLVSREQLSRVFVKLIGQTPAAYRRDHRR